MFRKIADLTLAKRYLWGTLIAALLPLLVIAFLYDRYSANLLRNIVSSKVEINLEATAAQVNNFVSGQVNRLKNIADLPEIVEILTRKDQNLSDRYLDLMLLETESPDIYRIEFSDLNGRLLVSVPASHGGRGNGQTDDLRIVDHNGVEILGPALPRSGHPGWFLIRAPVLDQSQQIGWVALRVRLASLTEIAAPLFRTEAYAPQIVVFDRVRLTTIGTQAEAGKILARSRQFIPGWRIDLIERARPLDEPLVYIRYILLLGALLSAIGLVALFVQMSTRMTGYLRPLTDGARAVSNGTAALRVSEDGPGELGSLGRSFNKMSTQLDAMIASRVDVERRATLGKMAAGIAHEIRNPLTTISATLHGLRRDESDPDRQEMYGIISEEIQRVDTTIAEFLSYAKPRVPQSELVDIMEVFESISTLALAGQGQNGITCSLMGEADAQICVDPAHFKQILLNITLNAIQALPDGGVIEFRAQTKGASVAISVSDNGVGIRKDDRHKILRPFFTTRASGVGLGMSITSQLVASNGGTLDFDSTTGQGTTVTLVFPRPQGPYDAID